MSIHAQLTAARSEARQALGSKYRTRIRPVMDTIRQYMNENHATPLQAFAKLSANQGLTSAEKKILAAAVVEIMEEG